MCWARTSSGLVGTRMVSIWPASMRCTLTAQPIRSVRCLGNSTPWEISPTWWPARPMRCSPLATDGGASTWITRSTAPMSMPEFQAGRRHHGLEPPGLQVVLDGRALLLADRAVVGAGQQRLGAVGLPAGHHVGGRAAGHLAVGCACQLDTGALGVNLVEPRGQSLGQPPGVGEHDRRVVGLDEVDDAFLDVGPDGVVLQVGHVRHRHLHGQVEGLGRRRRDDGRRAVRRTGTAPPPRAGAPSPTARSAGPASPAARRAAPATARGGRRAWCPPRRAPRRRSPSARRPASRGPPRSASGTATPAW